MGVFTYEMEIPTTISPSRIFTAFVLEFDTLFPKVVPQAIKSIELLEGDGGPGSIKKVTFGEGKLNLHNFLSLLRLGNSCARVIQI